METQASSTRAFLLLAATALAAIALVPNQAQAVDESPLAAAHQFSLGSANWRTAGGASALTYSPDGKLLVALSHDSVSSRGLIYIWDAETGQRIGRVPGAGGNPPSLRFSPDSRRLIARNAIVYEVPSGALRILRERAHNALDLTRDEQVMALAEFNGDAQEDQLVLWDLATNSARARLSLGRRGRRGVRAQFSPAGDTFCLASASGTHELRSTKDAALIRELPGTSSSAYGDYGYIPLFSPDGKRIILNLGWQVVVADIESGLAIDTLEVPASSRAAGISSYAWSPNSQLIAYCTHEADYQLVVRNVGQRKVIARIKDHSISHRPIEFSPNGKQLALGGATIRFFDTSIWQEINPVADLSARPKQIVFSPAGKTLATSIADQIFLWDLTTKSPRLSLAASSHLRIAFSPDGWALAAHMETCHRIWQTDTGAHLLTRYHDQRGGVLSPEFDQKAVLNHLGLALYELQTNEKIRELSPMIGDSRNRAGTWYSCDGRTLAVNAAPPKHPVRATEPDSPSELFPGPEFAPAVVTLWNTASGKAIGSLIGKEPPEIDDRQPDERRAFHDGGFLDVADKHARWGAYERIEFSPDHLFLAASRCPGEIDIWDLTTRRMLGQVYAGEGPFAFSADGRMLAVMGVRRFTLVETATVKPARRWTWILDQVESPHQHYDDSHLTYPTFGLSPDGNLIALGTRDSAPVECYSLAPSQANPAWQVATLDKSEASSLWKTLGEHDASAAYTAIWRLAAAKNGAQIIDARIDIPQPPDVTAANVDRLVAGLGADGAHSRQNAHRELSRVAPLAEPHLRKILESNPPPEIRTRIEAILAALVSQTVRLDGETVRRLRAIQSLERIGGTAASQTLRRLAAGEPTARETIAAQAALKRLAATERGGN